MGLANLPEAYFYRLLPSAVISGDVRGLIEAVVGGIQDRVCDFRSQTSSLNNLIVPDPAPLSFSQLVVTLTNGDVTTLNFATTTPPLGNLSLGDFAAQVLDVDPSTVADVAYSAADAGELVTFNVVQLSYTNAQGVTITRSLDVDATTPLDATSLQTWAVAQAGLDPSTTVVSVVYGTDVLRQVDANTIHLLAATVGASIYRSIGSTDPIADARRAVDGYFPRLKVKGTGLSFEILGRLIGFDDAAFIPLWGRLSPRFPADIGNSLNDADFAAQPQITPTPTLPSPTYDPNDLVDGDVFYEYDSNTVSGAWLTVDPSSTFYLPDAVNGANPFFNVEAVSTTLTLPPSGSYTLANGGPHVVASVALGTSGFTASAIAEGDSFNGLTLNVTQDPTGTVGVSLDAIARLSAIKYRTSYYDIRLTVDATRFATTLNGTIPVIPNADLEADPALDASDPYLSANGTAPSPFRPWKAGVLPLTYTDPFYGTTATTNPYTGSWPAVSDRVPAVPGRYGDPQLDLTALVALGNQAVAYMEDVRPATRQPRRSLTGLLFKDTVPYAPFSQTYTLSPSSGTFGGTIPQSWGGAGYPAAGYSVSFTQAGLTLGAETDIVNSHLIRLRGNTVSGTFATDTNTFFVESSGTDPVLAVWMPTTTDTIRPEPTPAQKLAAYGVQSRPEDELDAPGIEFLDDYPWRRGLRAGGQPVDLNSTTAGTNAPNLLTHPRPAAVVDSNGVTNTVTVHDLSPAIQPYRLVLTPVTTTDDVTAAPILSAFTDLYAEPVDGSAKYRVGAIGTVVVADPAAWTEPNHVIGLQGWWPMNEHPVDDLAVTDQSPSGAVETTAFSGVISPGDRVWDTARGWVLHLNADNQWQATGYRNVDGLWSIGIWLRADPEAVAGTGNILSFGPVQLQLTQTTDSASVQLSVNDTTYPTAAMLPDDGSWMYVVVNWDGTHINFSEGTFTSTMTAVDVTDATTDAAYVADPFDDTDTTVVVGGIPVFASDLRIWNVLPNQDLIRVPPVTATRVREVVSSIQNTAQTQAYATYISPQSFRVYPGPLPQYPGPDTFDANAYGFDEDVDADSIVYSGVGAYTGDPAYKQVGFGGGITLESSVTLGGGDLGKSLSGDGTAILNTPLVAYPPDLTSIFSGTDALTLWMRADLGVTADDLNHVTAWTDTLTGATVFSPDPANSGLLTTLPSLRPAIELRNESALSSPYPLDGHTVLCNADVDMSALSGDVTVIFAGSFGAPDPLIRWQPVPSQQIAVSLGMYSLFPFADGVYDGVIPAYWEYENMDQGPHARGFGLQQGKMVLSTGTNATDSSPVPSGNAGIYSWTVSGTNVNFFFNGTEYGSGTTPAVYGANGFCIGASPTLNMVSNGAVYEVMIFGSALPGSKRAAAEEFVATKYGLYYPNAPWMSRYSAAVTALANAFHWDLATTNAYATAGATGTEAPHFDFGFTNPGSNSAWSNKSAFNHDVWVDGGVTTTGSIPQPYWPAITRANPDTDHVYVRGDDGLVYTLTLENDSPDVGTYILPSLPFTPYPAQELVEMADFTTNPDLSLNSSRSVPVPTWIEQVTDTVTDVGDATGLLGVTPASGTNPAHVYVKAAPAHAPAPTVLYLDHSAVINLDQAQVYDRWEQPTPQLTDWNNEPVAATLSGELAFTNPEALAAGTYRITITSANIGTLDPDFAGFDVEITFGTDNPVIPVTLMPNGAGTNPTATDSFNVTVPVAVGGTQGWSLTFNWLNPRTVPSHSQQRELAIVSYRIDVLHPSLYAVTPSSGSNYLTPLITDSQLTGGWSIALDSGGNLVEAVHESEAYAVSAAPDDTASNLLVPAIDLITGSTEERAEDLRVTRVFQIQTLTLAPVTGTNFTHPFPVYDVEGPGYIRFHWLNFGGAVVPVRQYLGDAGTLPPPPILPGYGAPQASQFYLNGVVRNLWHY